MADLQIGAVPCKQPLLPHPTLPGPDSV